MKFYSKNIPSCFLVRELSMDDFLGREGEEGKFFKAVYDVLSEFGIIDCGKVMNEAYRECISIFSIKGYAEKYNYRFDEYSFEYGGYEGSEVSPEFLTSIFLLHRKKEEGEKYAIERLYKNIVSQMDEMNVPYEELDAFFSSDFPTDVAIDFSPKPDVKAIRKSLRKSDFDWEEITDGFDDEIIADILELCPEELRQDVERDIEEARYPFGDEDEDYNNNDAAETIASSYPSASSEEYEALRQRMVSMEKKMGEMEGRMNSYQGMADWFKNRENGLKPYLKDNEEGIRKMSDLLRSCKSNDDVYNSKGVIIHYLKSYGELNDIQAKQTLTGRPFVNIILSLVAYTGGYEGLHKRLTQ